MNNPTVIIGMMFIPIIVFVLGSAIGSFLNVLIDRLPNEESIMGRSHCDYCKKQLPWSVNIPIFSWFLLKGKTKCCQKPLSIQYPLIELLTGIVFVVVWLYLDGFKIYDLGFMNDTNFFLNLKSYLLNRIALLGILSTLIVIFFADLKYHIIPDSMQLSFFVFSLFYKIVETGHAPSLQHLLYGLVIMIPILFLFLVTLGRGMGFADVKLAFTIGFLLGIPAGIIALYIAFVTGAVVGIIMLLTKRGKMKSKIAFGPFLVLGIVVMLFWKEPILQYLQQWYGF